MSARCAFSWASCEWRCAYWRALAVDMDDGADAVVGAAPEEKEDGAVVVVLVWVVGRMDARGREDWEVE